MFQVRPVSRATIDAWPLSEAGLPTRVVNSAAAAGVTTIGQLRGWSDSDLLRLRSLGRVSLEQIHSFFKLCGRIERSAQRFQAIHEVLDVFLDVHQLEVISARYGFFQRDLKPSRSWMTLQEIGNQDNKTRERIRQIEETGKLRLQSRLAAVCLEPVYRIFTEFIVARSRAVPAHSLGALRGHEDIGELNPVGLVLLLSDLHPDQVLFHQGYFTTLGAGVIASLEATVLGVLQTSAAPVRLDALVEAASPVEDLPDPVDLRNALEVIADHLPKVAATVDERYFLYDTSVHPFILELLGKIEGPVHYRTVTSLFNDRLKPRSRKGAGYILDILNQNPACTRVDRGIYTHTPP